ncbi:mucin-2-like [Drosophila novamexicana]|uniref:mucin-2-like n=1 Tax=Drosophila novamexicana TaxID=47314 RepID=UPI0011E60556|nr:mucin-2-like [Drosophila novamexicana]
MFSFTLLACMAIAVCATPSQRLGESKLLQAIRSTSELQQDNPTRSLECFQYYSEIFDQLLQQYEQEFQACQNTSQLQISLADESFKPVLSSLNNSAANACELIDNCNNQLDSLTSLACYSGVGTSDAKIMYNISNTASQYYGQLQQRIQMIQFTEEQCMSESKRNYELSTDQAYVNLQGCLMGNEPVPIKTTTTTTTTDTTSSVPVRKTTTPIPVTSTSAPAETTSVPVKTTPEPVPEPTTSVPVTRTSVPVKTTSVPVTTTPEPATSSSAPIKTTRFPRRTTKAPGKRPKTTSAPVTFTTALTTATPTTSAAPGYQPSLSSELKKVLHSLLH